MIMLNNQTIWARKWRVPQEHMDGVSNEKVGKVIGFQWTKGKKTANSLPVKDREAWGGNYNVL